MASARVGVFWHLCAFFPLWDCFSGHSVPCCSPELYLGILFLCVLPSTVQSSIAFTSIAGGNVPAAVCSASASNVFAVFLTPILVGVLIAREGRRSFDVRAHSGKSFCRFLFLCVWSCVRPLIGGWVERRRRLTSLVDRGSILLVVYVAFQRSCCRGIVAPNPLRVLVGVLVIDCLLLAIVMVTMWFSSALFRFQSRGIELPFCFCGSKKSLATGVPIANVLFAGSIVGPMILPLMLFHQIQLMVCALLAQRWAAHRTLAR